MLENRISIDLSQPDGTEALRRHDSGNRNRHSRRLGWTAHPLIFELFDHIIHECFDRNLASTAYIDALYHALQQEIFAERFVLEPFSIKIYYGVCHK